MQSVLGTDDKYYNKKLDPAKFNNALFKSNLHRIINCQMPVYITTTTNTITFHVLNEDKNDVYLANDIFLYSRIQPADVVGDSFEKYGQLIENAATLRRGEPIFTGNVVIAKEFKKLHTTITCIFPELLSEGTAVRLLINTPVIASRQFSE